MRAQHIIVIIYFYLCRWYLFFLSFFLSLTFFISSLSSVCSLLIDTFFSVRFQCFDGMWNWWGEKYVNSKKKTKSKKQRNNEKEMFMRNNEKEMFMNKWNLLLVRNVNQMIFFLYSLFIGDCIQVSFISQWTTELTGKKLKTFQLTLLWQSHFVEHCKMDNKWHSLLLYLRGVPYRFCFPSMISSR